MEYEVLEDNDELSGMGSTDGDTTERSLVLLLSILEDVVHKELVSSNNNNKKMQQISYPMQYAMQIIKYKVKFL